MTFPRGARDEEWLCQARTKNFSADPLSLSPMWRSHERGAVPRSGYRERALQAAGAGRRIWPRHVRSRSDGTILRRSGVQNARPPSAPCRAPATCECGYLSVARLRGVLVSVPTRSVCARNRPSVVTSCWQVFQSVRGVRGRLRLAVCRRSISGVHRAALPRLAGLGATSKVAIGPFDAEGA
jgi:hypothetical protein